MIKIINLDLKETGVLQNAYDISYEKEENQIWLASFSLPLNDPKASLVKQLEYVHIHDDESDEEVGLYRVMDIDEHFSINSRRITVDCMHVIHTLSDSVIDGYYQKDNLTTIENINELLRLQNTKDWVLDQCDFRRLFSYSWENENGLLNALYSMPRSFNEPYIFEPDTSSYPWTLNLVKPDTKATCRIKEKHNLKGLEVRRNPKEMVNRIHAKGIGEGVNHLTFKKINGGKNYVQNDAAIAARGGRVISYMWVDRRFTNAEHLLASAKGLLEKWSQPIITWKISAIDLNKIHMKQTRTKENPKGEKLEIDNLKLGKVVQLDTVKYGKQDLRIVKVKKPDITSSPWDIQLEIGNVGQTLQGTLADSERQNEINTNYANGATNIIPYIFRDDVDATHPAILKFYLDDDVVNVNTCDLYLDTTYYRAHSKGNESTPTTVSSSTTEGGGGTTTTSGSGGGSQETSSAAGQATSTSSAGGDHRHIMFNNGRPVGTLPHYPLAYSDGLGNNLILELGDSPTTVLQTAESSGNHNHSVTTPAHTHTVSIQSHSHSITLQPHTHRVTITIPAHTHEIIYGIFEYGKLPTKIELEIDGKVVPLNQTSLNRYSLMDYLRKNDDGTISRGQHTLKITPDDLARFEVQLVLRVFIRSQLGGEF